MARSRSTRSRQVAFAINKTDASGNYTQVGFIPYDTTYSQGWHYTWGFDFGGRFADLAAGKVTPADPGIVKAFQFLKDWAAAMGPQKVQTFISTYAPPNNPPQQHPFLIGKVAMMVSGDWVLNSIRQYAPNLNYGVTYIPVPNKGDKPSTWAGGWSLVIPTGSKHPAEAFQFLSWMCGPDGQKMYTTGTLHLPTWKALLDDIEPLRPAAPVLQAAAVRRLQPPGAARRRAVLGCPHAGGERGDAQPGRSAGGAPAGRGPGEPAAAAVPPAAVESRRAGAPALPPASAARKGGLGTLRDARS